MKKEQDKYKLYEYTTYKFCGLEWYYKSGTFAASFDELHEIEALSTAVFITNKNQYIYIIGMNINYDEIEVIHSINHEMIHADENIPKGLFMKRYILPIHDVINRLQLFINMKPLFFQNLIYYQLQMVFYNSYYHHL